MTLSRPFQLLKGIIPLPTTVLATPRIAEELSRARDLTRFLGPKQLMPSEKKGTMVTDIESAIKANRGVVDWKVSRTGDISIGQSEVRSLKNYRSV